MLISSVTSATAFTSVGHTGRTPGLDGSHAPESTVAIETTKSPAREPDGLYGQTPVEVRESAATPVYDDPRIEAQRKARDTAEHQQQLVDAARIKELAARDREVRAHEQAHVAVGGRYAGGAVYQYERGPNGVNYAVGGEVSISVGPASTPEETLLKAQTIRRAALAPAEPSPQDMKVAAEASRLEAQARQELAESTGSETPAEKATHGDEQPATADGAVDATTPAALDDGNTVADRRNTSPGPPSTDEHRHDTPTRPRFLTGYQLAETIGGVINSRA